MAILSDRTIKRRLGDDLIIEPLDFEEQVGSCSIDLRLGGEVINHETGEEFYFQDAVEFEPGVPYLCTTIERVELPRDICAEVKGRSSIGREFVQVHEAGWVDCGFPGQITLEVKNHTSDVKKFPVGQRFCQLVLQETTEPPITSYPEKKSQKYADQSGPTSSRLHQEQEEES